MDVKKAVRIAAQYVADMESLPYDTSKGENGIESLADMDFAVEGTRFDEERDEWVIELGFVRPWDKVKNPLAGISAPIPTKRTFKNVFVSDDSGNVVRYGDSRCD